MRNSRQNLVFVAVLAVMITFSASMTSSAEAVPPGSAADGYLSLGELEINADPTINTDPAGAEMVLVRGSTRTADDSIEITADSSWKLTVEDANIATSNYDGKMRKGSWSGETWNYDNNPETALDKNFAVLVSGIGGNNFDTMTDAYDISSPIDIVIDDTTGIITVQLCYSQEAIQGDAAGNYRIELKYTLSSNP